MFTDAFLGLSTGTGSTEFYDAEYVRMMLRKVFKPWTARNDAITVEQVLFVVEISANMSPVFNVQQFPDTCRWLGGGGMATIVEGETGVMLPRQLIPEHFMLYRPYALLLWNLIQISNPLGFVGDPEMIMEYPTLSRLLALVESIRTEQAGAGYEGEITFEDTLFWALVSHPLK